MTRFTNFNGFPSRFAKVKSTSSYLGARAIADSEAVGAATTAGAAAGTTGELSASTAGAAAGTAGALSTGTAGALSAGTAGAAAGTVEARCRGEALSAGAGAANSATVPSSSTAAAAPTAGGASMAGATPRRRFTPAALPSRSPPGATPASIPRLAPTAATARSGAASLPSATQQKPCFTSFWMSPRTAPSLIASATVVATLYFSYRSCDLVPFRLGFSCRNATVAPSARPPLGGMAPKLPMAS
mmetsp:Transcript_29317/g.62340  ORF Transcript_29317/g.62340 Transcript_29317/m.62340 type:complete len:244 (+) Transcript_29317:634-1365(+)